jgi:hypothetical protein
MADLLNGIPWMVQGGGPEGVAGVPGDILNGIPWVVQRRGPEGAAGVSANLLNGIPWVVQRGGPEGAAGVPEGGLRGDIPGDGGPPRHHPPTGPVPPRVPPREGFHRLP